MTLSQTWKPIRILMNWGEWESSENSWRKDPERGMNREMQETDWLLGARENHQTWWTTGVGIRTSKGFEDIKEVQRVKWFVHRTNERQSHNRCVSPGLFLNSLCYWWLQGPHNIWVSILSIRVNTQKYAKLINRNTNVRKKPTCGQPLPCSCLGPVPFCS